MGEVCGRFRFGQVGRKRLRAVAQLGDELVENLTAPPTQLDGRAAAVEGPRDRLAKSAGRSRHERGLSGQVGPARHGLILFSADGRRMASPLG